MGNCAKKVQPAGPAPSVEEIGGIRIGLIQFGGITRKAYLDYVPDAMPLSSVPS